MIAVVAEAAGPIAGPNAAAELPIAGSGERIAGVAVEETGCQNIGVAECPTMTDLAEAAGLVEDSLVEAVEDNLGGVAGIGRAVDSLAEVAVPDSPGLGSLAAGAVDERAASP